MHIAIVGAGFCGLATAWHLTQLFDSIDITLFDEKGVGGGASGIAAGLLHPFAGAHAKLNRLGREGMAATLELLKIAEQALGYSIVANPGILRPALIDTQKADYQLCASLYPQDVEWWDSSRCQEAISGLASFPGLFIRQGIDVHASSYLQGLWLACSQRGVSLEIKKIASLKELESFDLAILTTGASTTYFKELSSLPLKMVKGQVLELAWPSHLPPLQYSLNSLAYLLMNPDRKTCLAGSTFERTTLDDHPDVEVAKGEILPKISAMIPALKDVAILKCSAGLRSTTPDHLPFIKQVHSRLWILAGMGSKGLLYHAYASQQLCNQVKERMGRS